MSDVTAEADNRWDRGQKFLAVIVGICAAMIVLNPIFYGFLIVKMDTTLNNTQKTVNFIKQTQAGSSKEQKTNADGNLWLNTEIQNICAALEKRPQTLGTHLPGCRPTPLPVSVQKILQQYEKTGK